MIPSDHILPEDAIVEGPRWGGERHAAGAREIELATEPGHLNILHACNPLRRYLVVGFASGYLGRPMPDTARVIARARAAFDRKASIPPRT